MRASVSQPAWPRRRQLIVFLLVGVALLAGCASGYKDFYRPSQGIDPRVVADRRPAPPPANPLVERAQPGNGDALIAAYFRRSYVLIGTSVFNSGRRESDASAVQQAKDVGADLVVILDARYTGSQTSNIPLTLPTATTTYATGSATAFGPRGPVTAYGSATTTTYGTTTTYIPVTIHRSDYGALYFVKQRSPFGVLVRNLNDTEQQELQSNKGVLVRAVAEGSPAFDADILPGDIIAGLDGIDVTSTAALGDLLRERSGRGLSVSIIRGGQRIDRLVHPTHVESWPPSAAKQAEVAFARGAAGSSNPRATPPGPPPPVETPPADPPAAPGGPGSPSPSAKGALEAKAAPTPPPGVERYSWIVGTWEALEDKSGVVEGLARFEVWHDGVQLRWRMRRAGWLSGVHTKQEASGTVSKISDSTVELNGKYEITNIVGVGQSVRYSLSRDSDGLRGYEFTNDGMQWPWFLRRTR
jgi:membrane-associated protease RseP (regulator of RpoE activity)